MHIAVAGPVTLEDIWLSFRLHEFREGAVVMKAQEAYLSHDKAELLVRSLIVERGFSKYLFLRLTPREGGGVLVGVDPIASPERGESLKRYLGLVAWQLLQSSPECNLASPGLEQYVVPPSR